MGKVERRKLIELVLREGQIAFENSRNETDYPWQSVDIIDYSDRNKRFGDH